MKKILIEGCRMDKGINKIVAEWRGTIEHDGDKPDEQDAAYIGHLVTKMLLHRRDISLIRIFVGDSR